MIEHIASWWDCEGLDGYIRRNRTFSDSNNSNSNTILRNILLAFRTRYEVEVDSSPSIPNTSTYNNNNGLGLGRNRVIVSKSESEDSSPSVIITPIPWVAILFVDGLWASLRTALLAGEVSPQDDDVLLRIEEIWTEIFKLHCISQT